jgi:hypothetical protein
MIARLSLLLLAAGMVTSASTARAGWCWRDGYLGQHHDLCFNNRFLQRPCPPYHGWNRPLYGWSSNYRPYYFTPQSYANTPWNYGPCRQEELLHETPPTPGLNSYGVPIPPGTKPVVKPAAATVPTLAPAAAPTYVPPTAVPQAPTPPVVPEPPKPSLM